MIYYLWKHDGLLAATEALQILFQWKDKWKVTLIGSRYTKGAESGYAPIKGDALAVVAALEKVLRIGMS